MSTLLADKVNNGNNDGPFDSDYMPTVNGTPLDKLIGIGTGQTWQDVLASRTNGVDYTNTTGKPIMVVIVGTGGGSASGFAISVDGVAVAQPYQGTVDVTTQRAVASSIVPDGSIYRVSGLTGNLYTWRELR